MTSTPIFDALAEEFDATWPRTGEVREPADEPADQQDGPLSGHLE
jgi:hypothetical protein